MEAPPANNGGAPIVRYEYRYKELSTSEWLTEWTAIPHFRLVWQSQGDGGRAQRRHEV